jgi:hypothetical protein
VRRLQWRVVKAGFVYDALLPILAEGRT